MSYKSKIVMSCIGAAAAASSFLVADREQHQQQSARPLALTSSAAPQADDSAPVPTNAVHIQPFAGTATSAELSPSMTELMAEAERRFPGRTSVSLRGGTSIQPKSAEEARSLKLELLRRVLLREALAENPQLEREVEQAVEQAVPMLAVVSWSDATGEHELQKVLSDTRGCGLTPDTSVKLSASEIEHLPCLTQISARVLWQPETELTVTPSSLGKDEPEWALILKETMKSFASDRYLARREHDAAAATTGG